MKRFISCVLLLALVLCLFGCTFYDTCFHYSDKIARNNFLIWPNEKANRCFVGPYVCTNYVQNLMITIPDECDGIPVTKIGGTFGRGVPVQFDIDVSDLYMNAPEGSRYRAIFPASTIEDIKIAEDYRIEELPFILNIGKNIKEIYDVGMCYYPHINEDGSITFYHPVVYVICSEENKYFYSNNGKLYDKKSDTLITDFAYWES